MDPHRQDSQSVMSLSQKPGLQAETDEPVSDLDSDVVILSEQQTSAVKLVAREEICKASKLQKTPSCKKAKNTTKNDSVLSLASSSTQFASVPITMDLVDEESTPDVESVFVNEPVVGTSETDSAKDTFWSNVIETPVCTPTFGILPSVLLDSSNKNVILGYHSGIVSVIENHTVHTERMLIKNTQGKLPQNQNTISDYLIATAVTPAASIGRSVSVITDQTVRNERMPSNKVTSPHKKHNQTVSHCVSAAVAPSSSAYFILPKPSESRQIFPVNVKLNSTVRQHLNDILDGTAQPLVTEYPVEVIERPQKQAIMIKDRLHHDPVRFEPLRIILKKSKKLLPLVPAYNCESNSVMRGKLNQTLQFIDKQRSSYQKKQWMLQRLRQWVSENEKNLNRSGYNSCFTDSENLSVENTYTLNFGQELVRRSRYFPPTKCKASQCRFHSMFKSPKRGSTKEP